MPLKKRLLKTYNMLKYIFTTISIFFINSSFACDCVYNTNSLIENYNATEVVFKGKVVSIKHVKFNNGNYDEVTFFVDKNFKGVKNKMEIVFQDSYSDCSIKFNVGEEWVVWAYTLNGRLGTNLCTLTTNVKSIAKEELELLKSIADTNGYKIWYDQKGDKIAEGILKNNVPDGYWKYYKYGFLNLEGLYDKGLKDGKWTTYYESILYQIRIDDKNKDVINNFLNGKNSSFRKINTIKNYKNGKMDGMSVGYNILGAIRLSAMYKENQLNGTYIVYENEKPKNIYSYKNNKLDGMLISFLEGGTIELLCNYKEGKQFGDWELFNEDGKVICSSKNGDTFPEFTTGKYNCKTN